MNSIDLVKFRKDMGLTQSALASILDMSQGFLSAVENGRAALPSGRLEMLKEEFPEKDLTEYFVEVQEPQKRSLGRLLRRIGKNLQSEEDESSMAEAVSDSITELNDKLYEARNRVFELQQEVIRLRELLAQAQNSNNQNYEKSAK